jgi:hypothetical protein
VSLHPRLQLRNAAANPTMTHRPAGRLGPKVTGTGPKAGKPTRRLGGRSVIPPDQHFRFKPGGIAFGAEDGLQHPGYRDFAYVAFTIGMCYQVSDTTLRDPQIRHTVLAHAVLSYVFGVVIVAGSVNLISGLFR